MKKIIKIIGIVFIVLNLIAIGALLNEQPKKSSEKIINKPNQDQKETKETPIKTKEIPVEKKEVPVEKKKLSIDELYEKITLGMNEAQVIEIAGEANMVSEAEIQGLGTAKNLVYYTGIDNLTISIQNGTVKIVVLGKMVDGKLTTKSKM